MTSSASEPYVFSRDDPLRHSFYIKDQLPGGLDHFLDPAMRLQLRDNAARMKLQEDGRFTYTVDVAGFAPDELTVDVQGERVVISGKHLKTTDGKRLRLARFNAQP